MNTLEGKSLLNISEIKKKENLFCMLSIGLASVDIVFNLTMSILDVSYFPTKNEDFVKYLFSSLIQVNSI